MGRKRRLLVATAEEAEKALDEVRDAQTADGTKNTYRTSLRGLIDWLLLKHPECVDQCGTLIVPIERDVISEFNGYISAPAVARKKYKSIRDVPPDSEEPFSYSYMNAVRSAVIDVYKENNLKLSAELDISWKKTLGEIYCCSEF